MKCQLCGERTHKVEDHPGLEVQVVNELDPDESKRVLDGLRHLARVNVNQALSFIDAVIANPNRTPEQQQPWIKFRDEIIATRGN